MTAPAKRTLLVTSALPYANGAPHLGHIVEYVQTDIWVRFQRMRGHDCLFIWASDAHGTPIMLKARQEGITPEQLIERVGAEQRRDFGEFDISYDNFHTTHSDENREVTLRDLSPARRGRPHPARDDRAGLRRAGEDVPARPLRARHVPQVRRARPVRRQLRGLRRHLHARRPDECRLGGERHGTRAEASRSTCSSSSATSSRCCAPGQAAIACSPPSRPSSASGSAPGLRDWDISRDEPYFGFEIPGETGKYFYVWLDAPIGYLSSLLQYCRRTGRDFDQYWKPDSDAEVYHFIGKDIVYFHTLFWPAVLAGAGYRPPTSVFAHGFLTVNGQKMSKSRGTLISARTWLDHLPAEYLRYYFASRLGDGVEDLDLNLDDFVAKVNSDIVGKLVNIASRCAGFIARGSAGRLAATLADAALQGEFAAAGERVAALYEGRDLAGAMREIMALTDRANLYIDQQKPWLMAKDPARAAEVQAVCTQGINLFRVLAVYLKPVMPKLAAGAEKFLGLPLAGLGRRRHAAPRHDDQRLRAARHAGRPGRGQGAARCLRREPEACRRAGGGRDRSSGRGKGCANPASRAKAAAKPLSPSSAPQSCRSTTS